MENNVPIEDNPAENKEKTAVSAEIEQTSEQPAVPAQSESLKEPDAPVQPHEPSNPQSPVPSAVPTAPAMTGTALRCKGASR